jgi:hypothetical protein
VLYDPPIINNGTVVKAGSQPLNITVLGFKNKRFVEKVAGGAKGQICQTEAEVIKAGGTTSWQEWDLKKAEGMRLFQPLAEALIAIAKPEAIPDDGTTFVYDIEGSKHALALWGMKGTAYTGGAKRFFTEYRMGCLRAGYPTFSWNLSTKLAKYGENFVFIPVLVPRAKSTPAFMEFVREVLTNPGSEA